MGAEGTGGNFYFHSSWYDIILMNIIRVPGCNWMRITFTDRHVLWPKPTYCTRRTLFLTPRRIILLILYNTRYYINRNIILLKCLYRRMRDNLRKGISTRSVHIFCLYIYIYLEVYTAGHKFRLRFIMWHETRCYCGEGSDFPY